MRKGVQAAGFRETTFNTGKVELNYVVGPDNGPLVLLPAQMSTWKSYQANPAPFLAAFQITLSCVHFLLNCCL